MKNIFFNFIFILSGCLGLLTVGCGLYTTDPSQSDFQAGMSLILAKGKQTTLGSDSPLAKIDEETPAFTTTFTYDFYMDKAEITQSSYKSLMGRNPVVDSKFGKGNDYPVYNVSWYDAVLYCNQRSKLERKDTVYTYSVRHQDGTGRTYDLTNLATQFEKEGYRLPTEAEWEFAARAGTKTFFPWGDLIDSAQAVVQSWFSGNSGGSTHSTRGLQPNAFGLFDMLGNVMEWNNDWKGPFMLLEAKDFLGNKSSGLIPERVVKGGAFSFDQRYLRYSARSANYATLPSAATEYVGFRCVLGKIASGLYLQAGGLHQSTPPVSIDVSAQLKFFGHKHVKLAFVNVTAKTRTLCFVDFSVLPVVVNEFLDDSVVFTPAISPDGQWVAYADVDEGQTRRGSISIRRLEMGSVIQKVDVPRGVIPRWWVDPVAEDTFLVYASSARDNLDPAWPSEATYKIKIKGGSVTDASTLLGQAAYHDGLSSNANFLVSGFRRLRLMNRLTGKDRILFTSPDNGKTLGDTSQVCNVSLSPDFSLSPTILMLDFGDVNKNEIVGRSYGLHEILFRIDTVGKVTHFYNAPKGFIAWQDVEWSNSQNYAIGLGEDQKGGYPAVVALNLLDSQNIVLARGSTLRHPSVWIKPGVFIPNISDFGILDSMGRYDEPAHTGHQKSWASKMRLFWSQYDKAEVMSLGSSPTECGIYPKSFTHFHTTNMGYGHGDLGGPAGILKNYVFKHCRRLRAVTLQVDPAWMFLPGGDPFWYDSMTKTKGYIYDSTHLFWSAGVPRIIDSITKERVANISSFVRPIDDQGGAEIPATGWGTSPLPLFIFGTGVIPDSLVDQNMVLLKSLVEQAQEMGILFVMTVMPQHPSYPQTGYYGYYGPTFEAGRQIVSNMRSFCDSMKKCRFYDANLEGKHDFDSTMFLDANHLATTGAKKFSLRLDSLLWKELGPGPK